jgi:RNA polymerase sigma-70 factor (ECF subfamily)
MVPNVAALQQQFLAAVRDIRPRLHRFCSRMCGSALDGEDRVQDTLAQGFFHLASLQDPARLEPWLFRIAHRKCIDFLRADKAVTVPYDEASDPRAVPDDDEPIADTLAPLVGELPPKERAAVVLKDVLQYKLEEVAEVVDSTVGGVKAALHRGRAKLRALHAAPTAAELDRQQRALLDAYVDCFNRQDWAALQQLIAADARLEVVDVVPSKPLDATYRTNYAKLSWPWRLVPARVDGELVIVHERQIDGVWRPHSAIRVWWSDGKVARIRDYVHIDYLLRHARIELI